VKRKGEGAASVLVELSRIWKKKLGGSGKKCHKDIPPTKKDDPRSILHEKQKAVKEKEKGKSKRKECRFNAKRTGVKETPTKRNERKRQGGKLRRTALLQR